MSKKEHPEDKRKPFTYDVIEVRERVCQDQKCQTLERGQIK